MARNEFVSTSIKTPLRVRHDISHVYFCPLFNSPYCARASSLLMLNDRTQTHHTRQESSGRVISPTQRHLPDSTQHSQETYIHAPRRDSNKQSHQASHLDRLYKILLLLFLLLNAHEMSFWLFYIGKLTDEDWRGNATCHADKDVKVDFGFDPQFV